MLPEYQRKNVLDLSRLEVDHIQFPWTRNNQQLLFPWSSAKERSSTGCVYLHFGKRKERSLAITSEEVEKKNILLRDRCFEWIQKSLPFDNLIDSVLLIHDPKVLFLSRRSEVDNFVLHKQIIYLQDAIHVISKYDCKPSPSCYLSYSIASTGRRIC